MSRQAPERPGRDCRRRTFGRCVIGGPADPSKTPVWSAEAKRQRQVIRQEPDSAKSQQLSKRKERGHSSVVGRQGEASDR